MPVGDGHAQTLAAPAATVGAGHVGLGPCLIDEDQAVGVQVELAIEPSLPALQDVGPLLLGGVRRLFLRVMPCRRKNRWSVP